MAVVSQAHTFVTGEVLTAATLNANPANFVSAFANIDNTNIGAAGLYASQIKPTTTLQATFGGVVAYTFPQTVYSGVAGIPVSGWSFALANALGTGTQYTLLYSSTGITVQGVTASMLGVSNGGGTNALALDGSG
ncbi:MAG: hypothetical protein WAN50_03370, partial [Minisyncoccia bacterium]